MTTCFLAPDPVQSTFFIPGTNTPGNGVLLFTYLAGTNTKATVYKDNAAGSSWTNPIVLDSGGNLSSGGTVWLPQGVTYKFVWAPSNDTDPPASPYRTIDNVAGVNDVTLSGVEWVTGTTPTFIGSTSFSVAGDQTATYTIGRRVKTTNTAGTVYGTVIRSIFTSLTTVTVVNDSGSLDSGLSAVSYGLLSSVHVSTPQASFNVQGQPCVRLTMQSGVPVTTSDIVSSVVFLTPYRGNTIDIYDGTANWNRYTFTEMSTVVPAATGVRDIFIYSTSAALAFTTVPWTNNSTRASSIVFQNGIPVLTGDTSKLYLGSYWATSGVIPDTASTRVLWNYWNRAPRLVLANASAASWVTSGTVGWRPWNEELNAKASILAGASDVLIEASISLTGLVVSTNAAGYSPTMTVGIGRNVTSAVSSAELSFGFAGFYHDNSPSVAQAKYSAYPGIGLHDLQMLYGIVTTNFATLTAANGTSAVSGVNNGMRGSVLG